MAKVYQDINNNINVRQNEKRPKEKDIFNRIIMRYLEEPIICELDYKNCKFLITNNPTDRSMTQFLAELKKHDVSAVVRACEPTYESDQIVNNGFLFYELRLDDGGYPSPDTEEQWFRILKRHFQKSPDKPIVVHCISGLGRAPVLVCIALMDLGLKFEDAVEMVRAKRRGAINTKQLNYLQNYKAKSKLKNKLNKKTMCSLQ